MTAFFLRARSRTAATSRAIASASGRLQTSGTKPSLRAASAGMMPSRDARPAVRLDRACAAGEEPPELLAHQAGDGAALGETVIARDRLEHLEVLPGGGEAADDLARSRPVAPGRAGG